MTTDQRIIERQNEFLKKIEIYKLHNVHNKVTRDKFGNILAVEEVEEVERQQTINPFMAGFVSKVTRTTTRRTRRTRTRRRNRRICTYLGSSNSYKKRVYKK